MSQYDFGTIDPFVVDGTQLAAMLNQWRDALLSVHRGPTRPDYAVPGMLWINDVGGPANWIVNVFMGPTIGDRPLYSYNTTTGAISLLADMATTALLHAQAAANPTMQWTATGNPANARQWRAVVTPIGVLRWEAVNDDGSVGGWLEFTRDGKITSSAMLANGVIVSPTPPPDPQPTMLWWNSALGMLFVYYDDGISMQWVPASISGDGAGSTTALVFPDSPAVGATFDAPNSITYVWTGVLWTVAAQPLGNVILGVYYKEVTVRGDIAGQYNSALITAPLVTGGGFLDSITFTPKSNASVLDVEGHFKGNPTYSDVYTVAMFNGSTFIDQNHNYVPSSPSLQGSLLFKTVMPSPGPIPTTLDFRVGSNSGGGNIWRQGQVRNGASQGNPFMRSWIVIRESETGE